MRRENVGFLAILMIAAITLWAVLPVSAQKPIQRPMPIASIADVPAAVISLTFGWEQTSADFPSLAGWGLYVRASSGTGAPAEQRLDVTYTGGTGPFTSSQTFTVSGAPGSVVRKYFVLDAVNKNGKRSGPSNEVFYDFTIPWADVTTPLSLTVTVSVVTN